MIGALVRAIVLWPLEASASVRAIVRGIMGTVGR